MIAADHIKRLSAVNGERKHPPINFDDYLFIDKKSAEFTALSPAQQTAIRNIEEYYSNRWRNLKNWKTQVHFSYKKETLSTRIREDEYRTMRDRNNSKHIRFGVRRFLWDPKFRLAFIERLGQAVQEEMQQVKQWCRDLTDLNDELVKRFPRVISGKVYNLEKELFVFYFTFMSGVSVSFAVKTLLVHFPTFDHQDALEQDEVPQILFSILSDQKETRGMN